MPAQVYLSTAIDAASAAGVSNSSVVPLSEYLPRIPTAMTKFLQWLHAAALLGLTAFNLNGNNGNGNAALASTLPYHSGNTGFFDVNALARDVNGNATQAQHGDGWKKHLNFAVDYYPSQWDPSYWESDAAGQKNASLSYVR